MQPDHWAEGPYPGKHLSLSIAYTSRSGGGQFSATKLSNDMSCQSSCGIFARNNLGIADRRPSCLLPSSQGIIATVGRFPDE